MVSKRFNEGGLAYLRSGYQADGLNSAIKVAESLGIQW